MLPQPKLPHTKAFFKENLSLEEMQQSLDRTWKRLAMYVFHSEDGVIANQDELANDMYFLEELRKAIQEDAEYSLNQHIIKQQKNS